jgi:hypothetical protein
MTIWLRTRASDASLSSGEDVFGRWAWAGWALGCLGGAVGFLGSGGAEVTGDLAVAAAWAGRRPGSHRSGLADARLSAAELRYGSGGGLARPQTPGARDPSLLLTPA